MVFVFLFIFGLAIGSFLNVVALRYDPEKDIFDLKNLGGRSHCTQCRRALRWYELVPILSFVFLLGKCRTCKEKISWQYPIVEFLTALVFISPAYFLDFYHPNYIVASILVLALLAFILLSLIDLKFYIIPDSINIFLAFLGIIRILTLYLVDTTSYLNTSFLGGYALLFSLSENLWLNYIMASLFGFLFFGMIIYITKGRGMGMGDLKLITVLGLLLGWPDILLIILFSFVIGGIVGGFLMFRGAKKLKDPLPFGPFIVSGALTTIFFGETLLKIYFSIFNI